MTNEAARLVFLSGPEAGRVVDLAALPAVIGRSSRAQIRVAEPYASREQAVFTAAPEGVIVENLSGKGTEIGGKVFRKRKPVLLATGDVIRLGLETQVLFVAAGDDLDAARGAAMASLAASAPAAPEAQPEAEPLEPLPAPPPEEEAEAPEPAEEPRQPLTPAQAQARESRRRMRRIYVGLGVYLLAMAVVAGLLWMRKGSDDQPAGPPPRLTRAEIGEALKTPATGFPDTPTARQRLETARARFYDRRLPGHPGYRYEALRAYQEYLAYSGESRWPEAEDFTRYDTTLRELSDEVGALYDRGYAASQQRRWSAAEEPFARILELVPDPGNRVSRNAAQHLAYVRQQRQAERKGSSRW